MLKKYDLLVKEFKGDVDVLIISETKLENIFLEYKFKIPGFALLFPNDQK